MTVVFEWQKAKEPLHSRGYEWWRPHDLTSAHLIYMGNDEARQFPRHGAGKALCGAHFEHGRLGTLSHFTLRCVACLKLERAAAAEGKCVTCHLPLSGVIVGTGAGGGEPREFAHEVCYWRYRAKVAEKAAEAAIARSPPLELPTEEQEETRRQLASAARDFSSLKHIGDRMGTFTAEQAMHHAAFRFVAANVRAYNGGPGPVYQDLAEALDKVGLSPAERRAAIFALFERAATPPGILDWTAEAAS